MIKESTVINDYQHRIDTYKMPIFYRQKMVGKFFAGGSMQEDWIRSSKEYGYSGVVSKRINIC